MFWSVKKEANRHIIAIKNYETTLKSMKDGSLYLPFSKEIYFKLLEINSTKLVDQKGMGKFIRASNKEKGEVRHFWEGLLSSDYTLINVIYAENTPPIEKLCNGDSIKYICDVKF